MSRLIFIPNVSAVTAACMALRREVFGQVGGFDEEHLGVAYNDVDLFLKVQESGYPNLWTPSVELYHYAPVPHGVNLVR